MNRFILAIIYISLLPILATVILAAKNYRKSGKSIKAFSWFIFLSGFIQFISSASPWIFANNMPFLHLYVAAGLPCLVWFYKTVLDGFISSRIMWGIAVAFLVFTIINSLFFQDIFHFNSYALFAEALIIIILALFTFMFLLNNTMRETGIPDIKSITWINAGLFIYYLTCLMLYYFGETLFSRYSRELLNYTWLFHDIVSMVMYCCFFIGLWKRSKIPSI